MFEVFFKDEKHWNTRIYRWVTQLQQYSFEVCLVSGKLNQVADALSRAPANPKTIMLVYAI